MTERLIHIGVASYRNPDGLNRFGMQGETVDVHPDDLERFDRLNPAPAELAELAESVDADAVAEEIAETVEKLGEVLTSGEVDLDQLDLAGLRAYAAEHGIDLGGAVRKPDIAAVIQAAI